MKKNKFYGFHGKELFFSKKGLFFVYYDAIIITDFSDLGLWRLVIRKETIMKNGWIKVAAALPHVKVADPVFNADEAIRLCLLAEEKSVKILVFPELNLTGYTCADLFFSESLLTATNREFRRYLNQTKSSKLVSVLGLPLRVHGKLYDCAAFCQSGKILGIVPKTNIPNYSEYYEARWFSSYNGEQDTLQPDGLSDVPFGTELIFTCQEIPSLKLAAEICEDLWVTVPPSSRHTEAGATVICNPSASNEAIAKNDYRRNLVKSQSAKAVCAYIYASAGPDESTTDVVFSGHSLITENGNLLAERNPFDTAVELLISEIDLERITHERLRMTTFADTFSEKYREIRFSLPLQTTELTRKIDSKPFVPYDESERYSRCETILSIQSHGLQKRIVASRTQKLVLGISGGLDSTLALLVSVRAMDFLNRPRQDIIAVTMPCFGTTNRTKNNATILCRELGVTFKTIDIKKAVLQHFKDIGQDPDNHDVTYENAQARERTQVLMDIANSCNGLVVGTGDLSELALGWATYNGDHMSMYGVNASVPKTLVRHIVSYAVLQAEKAGQKKLAAALKDVLETPVSPELLPADADGTISQKTEDLVGPYEIHDFYLYYFVRFGFRPEKLYRMACIAFRDTYTPETLRKWLVVFLRRFFAQQFKRSCLPDGPKVGSIALSPRGDWRMPSDASSEVWISEAEALV